MASTTQQQLPINGEGSCMTCKEKPTEQDQLTCSMCGTPWHVTCLASSSVPETMASVVEWSCPDCSFDVPLVPKPAAEDGIVAKVRAIEADETLSEREKAKRRQRLLSGKMVEYDDEDDGDEEDDGDKNDDVLQVLGGTINCSFCMQLPERPVTTPCGHNFCLKCFEKWVGQGKRTCAKCRQVIPSKMASQPRINSGLVAVIRMARISKSVASGGVSKVFHFVHNVDRPVTAYTTERAKRSGKANAASGKIFVTVAPDHFGPISAENDPERNQGVLVGESWEDRLECRQWGAHLPHVAGIAGQSEYGAQSVALSGGYLDDEDHGEWFLYTGSGGRDLSGNKRTNKEQSFDQKFDKMNQALRVSCLKGYPVRVVRSHKEKRSSYAPEKGVRYDGVYRIEKCWRKVGIQGFKVCRYLFVRCDNEPAPWTSDENGDRPRRLPVIGELKKATDITERTEGPSWDYDEDDERWKWKKSPPKSKKPVRAGNPEDMEMMKTTIRKAQNVSMREKLLKGFSCLKCQQVMNLPVTTPCGHNFCKSCLEGAFVGQTAVKERNRGGRVLRAQKNVLQCPHCPVDISDFLQDIKVNRDLMNVIESLKRKADDEGSTEETSEKEIEAMAEDASEDCSEKNEEGDRILPEKVDESSNEDLHAPKMKGCKKRRREDSSELTSENGKETTTKDGSEDLSGKNDEAVAGGVANLDENIDSAVTEPIGDVQVPSSKYRKTEKEPDSMSCS